MAIPTMTTPATTLETFFLVLLRLPGIPNGSDYQGTMEAYLGDNWRQVVKFWELLDSLTETQLESVVAAYGALSFASRRKMQEVTFLKTYDRMDVYRDAAGNAARLRGFDVAAMATFEVIGGHSDQLAFPLFINSSKLVTPENQNKCLLMS